MELVQLDPKAIMWPELRVTAYYQEGQEEMLKESLAAMGQQQPIVVVKVGEEYIGVDGLHRCEAAIGRGDEAIPCVIREGDEKDALMSNLVLNHLRGRTKASEQVAVLGELFDTLGVTIEELEERTGHSRDWVERMIVVSRATAPVRQALDEELISLGHAYELALIEDPETQERVCHQLLIYRWSVKDLRDHIRAVKGTQAEPRSAPSEPEQSRHSTITCGFCHEEAEPNKVTVTPVCVSCAGYLVDFLRARNAGVAPQGEP